MDALKKQFDLDTVVSALIRPPRATYSLADLGKTSFNLGEMTVSRTDFATKNDRNLTIYGSIYQPTNHRYHPTKLPAVIYCHGNTGCRKDAEWLIPLLLPYSISLVAFDFAGAGNSEGEYISLGHFEADDIGSIIKYLRDKDLVTTVGLYGHSMGASSSFLYAQKDPIVASMVLDSPFSSMELLMTEVVKSAGVNIPNFVLSGAVKLVNKSCKSKAGMDIKKLDLESIAPSAFIPALFGHGENDQLILPHHSKRLHKAYGGDSNLVLFPGGHSSIRPDFFKDSVVIWFVNTLLHADSTSPKLMIESIPGKYFSVPPLSSQGSFYSSGISSGYHKTIPAHFDSFSGDHEADLQMALAKSMETITAMEEGENESENNGAHTAGIGSTPIPMTEEEMIAEAIKRSMDIQ